MSNLKDLTLPQLRQLLAEHDEHRPTFGTPEFKAWATKKEELKFWVELGQAKEATSWKDVPPPDRELPPCPPPPAPKPDHIPPKPEEPMPNKPLSQLTEEEKEARRQYHRDWKAKNRDKRKPKAKKAAKPKVEKAKEAITHGVRVEIQKNGVLTAEDAKELGRKLLAGVAGPEPQFIPSRPEIHIDPTPRIPSTSSDLTNVREIRRRIWLLMADLEEMTQEERQAIEPELGLLDAAAHSAHQLALGRLEVA